MQILNDLQINQKIERLAYQIYENNFNKKKIILAGINNNGMAFAKYIEKALSKISDQELILSNIRLNPAKPLDDEISIDIDKKGLSKANIIIVDDVANTGRTIFYAFDCLLSSMPNKIEVAVLVDRQHKNFPIQVDYVGMSLATTIKENIVVDLKPSKNKSAYLE